MADKVKMVEVTKANLFSLVEQVKVTLKSKGVYIPTEVYEREGYLFARKGSGYIRLYSNGKTSVPSTGWESFDLQVNESFKYRVGQYGWLETCG